MDVLKKISINEQKLKDIMMNKVDFFKRLES